MKHKSIKKNHPKCYSMPKNEGIELALETIKINRSSCFFTKEIEDEAKEYLISVGYNPIVIEDITKHMINTSIEIAYIQLMLKDGSLSKNEIKQFKNDLKKYKKEMLKLSLYYCDLLISEGMSHDE